MKRRRDRKRGLNLDRLRGWTLPETFRHLEHARPRRRDYLKLPPIKAAPLFPDPPRAPRQSSLFLQRNATVQALGQSARKLRRDPLAMRAALREAICADYRKATKQRREVLHATKRAGKGRRITGPRQYDWRKEFC